MYKYIFLVVAILFIGCTTTIPYTSSKAYYMVIKNPKIALADTGFVKKDDTRLNLQIFSASSPIFDLHVENQVCLNAICFAKEAFNYEFFNFRHYENFIEELFNLQPIYNQKNIQKNENGFEQRIKTNSYDITYKVENNNLYFKDKKNGILIKLKELKK
ncbi:hypothetical protein [Sulfurospirillum arcachonense]|uniref:hypothetical protein n=1 Tax=Sulfurospirillum arcachonense TaxID=57666 RepID=UPI0004696538|nr:hypothetical protein [Sulfurospirillum arcachonense]